MCGWMSAWADRDMDGKGWEDEMCGVCGRWGQMGNVYLNIVRVKEGERACLPKREQAREKEERVSHLWRRVSHQDIL